MSDRIGTIFGFLGGTIVAVESGYKVFPHPKPEKVYNRLGDAKWFLALRWCDALATPAGIINHLGELTFINQVVLEMGEDNFIAPEYRKDIFDLCLPLKPNENTSYELPNCGAKHSSDRGKSRLGTLWDESPVRQAYRLSIQALEIDPRYGKVALVQTVTDHGDD